MSLLGVVLHVKDIHLNMSVNSRHHTIAVCKVLGRCLTWLKMFVVVYKVYKLSIQISTLYNMLTLPVFVSFDPISYTVTEGDGFAELILIRSGDLSRATVVTVTTADGTATGER